MSAREHFHGVVAALQPVVHGVPDGALSQATPCEGFDVRALVSHLLSTTEALRRVGAGEPPVEIADKHGETGRSMGAFGLQVTVDDDAPPFDHALGQAGRDPDWSA